MLSKSWFFAVVAAVGTVCLSSLAGQVAKPRPTDVPPGDPDWTPRPATGPAEPWEKATEPDWVDGRFREMDTGETFHATCRYPLLTGKNQPFVYKGLAVRLGEDGKAGVLFDRGQLAMVAGWQGGYLRHTDRRYGLMNTPTPVGGVVWSTVPGPGWASPAGAWQTPTLTRPLASTWGRFDGTYRHGRHVVLKYRVGTTQVLESPTIDHQSRHAPVLIRIMEIGAHDIPMKLHLADVPADGERLDLPVGCPAVAVRTSASTYAFAAVGATAENVTLTVNAAGRVEAVLAPSDKSQRIQWFHVAATREELAGFVEQVNAAGPAPDLTAWTKPGPTRWPTLTTQGEMGAGPGPFAIDTFTIPYENPFKALFFVTGVDFLPTGAIAVCTVHGDVWLVRADADLKEVKWQRYATGLYHPIGLKVIEGKVYVLERGQLTRLHDDDGDGTADFYENVCNDWDTGPGEHSYDTGLETDPEGNFYFFKTGDTNLPTGGTLLKVARDGGKVEVFCTGFRHPIGLGMSPTGIVSGADQEGNWMPATRIDQYRLGGFYGDMRGHHRPQPPKTFDGPWCWLPREADNSAGGQVWVPPNTWGPLAGRCLHFSYGRCKIFLMFQQEVDGVVQGGALDLGLLFLSGGMRGRFHPTEGHLYAVGLYGWQTAARKDGCLQRVRYLGTPIDLPLEVSALPDGLRLTFSQSLDRATAENTDRYRVDRWNYRWSGEYGSPRFSITEPKRIGQDRLIVQNATLQPDGRTVVVKLADMRPAMQMATGFNLLTSDQRPLRGIIYHTIHKLSGTSKP
jgi:hypothetical protein